MTRGEYEGPKDKSFAETAFSIWITRAGGKYRDRSDSDSENVVGRACYSASAASSSSSLSTSAGRWLGLEAGRSVPSSKSVEHSSIILSV